MIIVPRVLLVFSIGNLRLFSYEKTEKYILYGIFEKRLLTEFTIDLRIFSIYNLPITD